MSLSLYHLPLAGYFALIGGLSFAIAPTFAPKRLNAPAVGFLALAIASVGVTWTFMLQYFQLSFEQSAHRHGALASSYTTHEWLADVSLFHEAWFYVCDGASRWWWSQQLCLWTTGPLLVLFYTEGRRFGIKRTWAYVLLAQVVAVSFAQALFFVAVAVNASAVPDARPAVPGRPAVQRKRQISVGLVAALLIGTASTVFVPQTLKLTSEWLFLPNLLFLHAVILLPFVPALAKRDKVIAPRQSRLYLNFAFIALRFRFPIVFELLNTVGSSVTSGVLRGTKQPFSFQLVQERLPAVLALEWNTLLHHPAQASISSDVVLTAVGAVAYLAFSGRAARLGVRQGPEQVPATLFVVIAALLPVVGLPSALAIGYAVREGKREAREEAEAAVERAKKEAALSELAKLGAGGEGAESSAESKKTK